MAKHRYNYGYYNFDSESLKTFLWICLASIFMLSWLCYILIKRGFFNPQAGDSISLEEAILDNYINEVLPSKR